ncbi:hypothetical protein LOTGIDRAFT_171821 [Lottia gigantea]|uniref:Uncharacterized protein n=1 Tax=Lottia gigantea TaxID=225164 RepID=V4CK63_LOTGI|nr:hypothetical protein LOTGIDRAFT_171821 [Lottia gigantea]ESP02620.1 hypothetical protein LOTGIDRAFT_171821 [Lottia gigantea]
MGLYFISLLLFGLAASSIAEKVTLTQINLEKSHYAAREKRSARFMQNNIFYRMEDENGLYVVLNLTKIDLPATTIIKDGKSVKSFTSGEDVATYVDFNRDGVFMLGLRRDSKGFFRYDLIGTFRFGKRRVAINPDPIIKTLYNIVDDDGIVDYRGDSIYPPGYVPVIKPTRQSRALTNYIIEVCFLADYAIYQKFLTKNANDAAATQTEMSTYYAFHAEQLRVRYKTVQEIDPTFSISIVNSGLVIFTDPADIPFVETNKVADTINSSLILSEFRNYINNIPAGITIPDSDHYMLFSGYDLFSASTGSLSNAGLAYTGVLCTTYAMSLVEDRRRERSAITAAHELAHGVGAGHDSNEGCDNADQYIMTAVSNIGAITSTEIAKRRWTFSSCSVAAFKLDLESTDCLFDNRYGDGELSASPKLGQIYSKDDQCRFAVADNSSYYGEDPGEECYKMKCLATTTTLRYVIPLDYSDCGTDKWCVHGECVAKPASEPPVNQAPTINNLPTTHDVAENENGVVFSISSSDPESDPIAYSYRWNSPNNADTYFDFNTQTGEVSIKAGVTLNYAALQNIVFNVTVTATDDQGGASSSENLILRITQAAAPNNAPVITNTVNNVQIVQSVPPTQTILDVDATDADPGDSPTFTANWVNPANGGSYFDFNPTTGVITKKPGATLTAGQIYTVEVTASDGKDTSATKTFNIRVNADPNTPPTIINPNSGSATVTLNSLTQTGQIFDFNAVDDESDPFSFQVVNWSPANGGTYFDLNPSDGTVSIKSGVTIPPSSTFALQVTATDSKAASSQPTTLIINTPAAVNLPPILTKPPNSGSETVQLFSLEPADPIYDFDGVDPEGAPVQYTIDSYDPNDALQYFAVVASTGAVIRTDVPLPPGTTFILNVKVSDGTLDSSPGTVIIKTPVAVNQPPILTKPPNSGTETVQLFSLEPADPIYDFDGVDPEGAPVQYTIDSYDPNDALQYFAVVASTGAVIRTDVPLPPGTTFILNVKVSDGTLDSSPGTVIIKTPVAVNQPPILTKPPNSGTETVQLTSLAPTGTIFDFNGEDPEGATIRFIVDSVIPSDASTYFFVNPQTGEVSRTDRPLPPSTTFTLNVKVSDGTLNSVPGTVIIKTPDAPSGVPVIIDPTQTASILTTTTGLIGGFVAIDPNGDPLTYEVDSWIPLSGSQLFYLNPQTGDITVKPGAILPPGSTYTVNVKASDGTLTSNIGTLVINVQQPPNDPPVFNVGNYAVTIPASKVGDVITVIANDPNPGDTVTYSVNSWNPIDGNNYFVINPATGVISVRPGVSLPPNRVFVADVSASDGSLSGTARVTITIAPDLNTAPVITNLNDVKVVTTSDQAGVIFTVTSRDDQNDLVTYTGTWDNQIAGNIFTFNSQTGEVSLKSTPFLQLYLNNQFTLTVSASDGQLSSVPKTLTVRISQNNSPPKITNLPETVTVMENPAGMKFFTVQATDPENDNIVFSETWEPSWAQYYFSFDKNTGEVASKPSPYLTYTNFMGQVFKLSVTAADLYGTSSTETLTISVGPATGENHPPKFSSANYFATVMNRQPGGPVYENLDGKVTDQDAGDTKSFSLQNNMWSSYFNINQLTGAITFASNKNLANLPNQLVLTVDVTDRVGDKDTASLLINIQDQPPTLPRIPNLPASVNIPEESNGRFIVQKPPVSQQVTFSMTSSPANAPFQINPQTGEITQTTPLDYESLSNKVFTLTIKGTDSTGTSTPEETLTFTVINVNESPVFTQQVYQVTANAGQAGQVVVTSLLSSVNDPDANDYIRFQILPGAYSNYFSINPNTGAITYATSTLGASLPNPTRLTVQATDSRGLSSTAQIDVTIKDINNDPPTFLNLPATKQVSKSQQSGVTIFDVNAQDPEGQPLTYSITNSNSFPQFLFQIDPSSGVVSLGNGYTIQSFSPQNVELMISVSDGSKSTEKSLTLSIGSTRNQPPVFNPAFFTAAVDEGPVGTVVFDAGLATDPNGDPITYQLEFPPANGFSIDQSTGVIRYSQDYYLSYGLPSRVILSVSAYDPSGLKADALVLVTVREKSTPLPLKITNLPGFKILNRLGNYPLIYKVETSGGSDPKNFQLENDGGVFNINSNTGEITLKSGISLNQFSQTNHQTNLRVIVTDSSNRREEGRLTVVIF